ncbi:hypothetical protein GCM10010277_86080 [Streptomyces longisporoflavus]|uniref:hypothetical protein n=1 Tax=Streptomyces longisporoflavus TaxID=28044 RepID=UPI00167D6116|nr:hypothetical protein [Streptomyces longisporoflavus]GGV72772.1 hypothetical protein GCM10010277_86080 [Streptomyces longisporoflavus]
MSDAPIPRPQAELSAAYWLDSPVLEQHGLCSCLLEDDTAPRRRGTTAHHLLTGLACALIVTALATVLSA